MLLARSCDRGVPFVCLVRLVRLVLLDVSSLRYETLPAVFSCMSPDDQSRGDPALKTRSVLLLSVSVPISIASGRRAELET